METVRFAGAVPVRFTGAAEARDAEEVRLTGAADTVRLTGAAEEDTVLLTGAAEEVLLTGASEEEAVLRTVPFAAVRGDAVFFFTGRLS